MPKFPYGTASKVHLSGVRKVLKDIYIKAADAVNIQILDGIRTFAEQQRNLATGASQTLNSRHLPQPPDNLSCAIDAWAYPSDYDTLEKAFNAVKRVDPELKLLRQYHMQGVIKGIAIERGVDIRQGNDWDGDGEFADQSFNDMFHTELKK